jgi:hypothetical protein
VPLPGETILVAAALLASTTGQIGIVVVVLARGRIRQSARRRSRRPLYLLTSGRADPGAR